MLHGDAGDCSALQFDVVSYSVLQCVAAYTCKNEPQGVHAALPLVFLKVPNTHETHTPPSFPVYPGSHVQFAIEGLPLGEKE